VAQQKKKNTTTQQSLLVAVQLIIVQGLLHNKGVREREKEGKKR
jgi:hypothetical protein